jgi:hypothetical protein
LLALDTPFLKIITELRITRLFSKAPTWKKNSKKKKSKIKAAENKLNGDKARTDKKLKY